MIGIDLSDFYNLLDFCDDSFSGCTHVRIEVSSGFVEDEIAGFICSFSLNQSKVANYGLLHQVLLTLEDASGSGLTCDLHLAGAPLELNGESALLEDCPHARRGVEGRNACSAGPDALCE
jgi:hypothetical protein